MTESDEFVTLRERIGEAIRRAELEPGERHVVEWDAMAPDDEDRLEYLRLADAVLAELRLGRVAGSRLTTRDCLVYRFDTPSWCAACASDTEHDIQRELVRTPDELRLVNTTVTCMVCQRTQTFSNWGFSLGGIISRTPVVLRPDDFPLLRPEEASDDGEG